MEKKGLSHTAYGGVPGDQYEPYVPASTRLPEMTVVSLIMGIILALLFGATNTYLGLKVGMTVSASIPGAVLGTAIIRGLLRRQNILETNIIQAIGSAGESIASGVMFTLPALIIWGFKDQFTLAKIAVVATLGTILGVLFVVPLRKNLTVDEHGILPYPEGMATAEVLVAGQVGGSSAAGILWGGLIGGIYKLLSGAFGLFKEEIEWKIPGFKNGIFGFDILASLMGVGFIVGLEIGLYMFAGGLLAWFVLIPLISYFGAGVPNPIFPSTVPIAEMDAWAIWSKYIRYIGAGAVAAGGFISLGRSLPMIINSFKAAMGGLSKGQSGEQKRTNQDISVVAIFFGVLGVFITAIIVPQMKVTWMGALSIILFGFFFAAVSARIAGLVGVSNLPVSGMTIAALLASTLLLKATGVVGTTGMIASITTGATICVAISIAGSLAQNLKTAHIIGATPKYVQIGVLIGGIASTVIVGWVILMLNQAYGLGTDRVPAPQATLMSMVVKGVMTGTLPWALVLAGVVIGIILAVLKLPILPVAIGLYLPLHLSTGVLAGGIIRWIVDRTFSGEILKEKVEKGILFASGLIAGDALMGIVIAFLAYKGLSDKVAFFSNLPISGNPWWGFAMFVVLGLILFRYVARGKKEA
ncbi:OPT family oligopeptide transporter [Carboxydothermus pertinax]|uniref:Oligopeptide transporter, OPT family n=1 Tax=Carboxydothermus pertinax TaxID=870242 RepID=A0A1L8CYC0_9THEO|nr:oligopeptide transporter, OPT family [Carboxydothermus pertinax]GAV23859.1 oligopeptide transporter, OPT family [Carboxydothermus pertinax]